MRPAVLCLLFVILCVIVIQNVSARVGTYDVPRDLAVCFGRMKRRTTLRRTPAVAIKAYCINMFLWRNLRKLNVNRGANRATINYIRNLFLHTKEHILHFNFRRKKRQAEGFPGSGKGPKHDKKPDKPLRVRKEIRMMSDDERYLFFDAINSMKNNKSISPNKYEALAEFHTGLTAVSAHGGCNFHGWHRLYILMYENALRDEGPQYADVTVPYWDSTIEDKMDDPLSSALWSDRFMGSCEGEVKGGFMKDGWQSMVGTITRNCNVDGPLMNDAMIKNMTKLFRFKDICGEESDIDNDMEFNHNGVHRWANGQMGTLAGSVHDPLFWLHHTFMDYIWELFRENQIKEGIDPSTDYPANPVTMGAHELHMPTADIGFHKMTVLDGLSLMFTKEWYRYDPRPTCHKGKKDCGSKYLKCVKGKKYPNLNKFVCIARTLAEVEAYEAEQQNPTPAPCDPPVKPPNNKTEPVPPKEIKPFQNTFCMNGKSDSNQWVYVPVKIILKRPPDYKSYGSYPVHRGKIIKAAGDIYAPRAYENIYRHLHKAVAPAKYDDCIEPDTPTNTIYIQSTGLNYEGDYTEFAIMDKRLAISVGTAYLAVRRPMSVDDMSVAMFNAQDSCGRVCKPICKVPKTEIFRPCSGAVQITGGQPLQFGNSFGDAVLDVWDFASDDNCPQLKTNNIIVSFYCDYSTDWIWPTIDEPPSPPPPPPVTTTIKPTEQTTVTAGCSLGFGCVIGRPCISLTTCVDGEFLDCLKSCHIYARCKGNQYNLYRCRRGERYLRGVGCVAARDNPCDYRQSGLHRWNRNRRRQRQRGRKRRAI